MRERIRELGSERDEEVQGELKAAPCVTHSTVPPPPATASIVLSATVNKVALKKMTFLLLPSPGSSWV